MRTPGDATVQCRFEDRLTQRALVLHHALDCITASTPTELDDAFARIAAAQARGHWVALLLDYALGEWLVSGLVAQHRAPTVAGVVQTDNRESAPPVPRLTAWVFAHAQRTTPWSAPEATATAHPVLHCTPGVAYATYRHTIDTLRTRMAQGAFYQANYTFPIHVTAQGCLEDVYRRIANAHPSAHAVWFRDARRTILSFSPELFVARTGPTLTVRPMKGTAPRDTDPDQDHRNADTLLRSDKNRAENLMIVDLLRNDLGRIATPGSVQVISLFQLEAYPSVWTLTSTITAHAAQRSLQDVLRALFPCGSITGAPKIAAMRALHQVEPQDRGIYCGSLGWLAPNGDFSLNVAIRTLEFPRTPARTDASSHPTHTGRFGVGGGIVYDSCAEQEWQECLWKARLLDGLVSHPDPQRLLPAQIMQTILKNSSNRCT